MFNNRFIMIICLYFYINMGFGRDFNIFSAIPIVFQPTYYMYNYIQHHHVLYSLTKTANIRITPTFQNLSIYI